MYMQFYAQETFILINTENSCAVLEAVMQFFFIIYEYKVQDQYKDQS